VVGSGAGEDSSTPRRQLNVSALTSAQKSPLRDCLRRVPMSQRCHEGAWSPPRGCPPAGRRPDDQLCELRGVAAAKNRRPDRRRPAAIACSSGALLEGTVPSARLPRRAPAWASTSQGCWRPIPCTATARWSLSRYGHVPGRVAALTRSRPCSPQRRPPHGYYGAYLAVAAADSAGDRSRWPLFSHHPAYHSGHWWRGSPKWLAAYAWSMPALRPDQATLSCHATVVMLETAKPPPSCFDSGPAWRAWRRRGNARSRIGLARRASDEASHAASMALGACCSSSEAMGGDLPAEAPPVARRG